MDHTSEIRNPYIEEKIYIDGIACPYLCHLQAPEKSGIVYPAHFHSYIEMLYTLSGQFLLYVNGHYQEFAEGDFVLINSMDVHQIEALSEDGGAYIVVRFLPELIYDGTMQNHFELKYLLPFITENTHIEKILSSGILNDRHSVIPDLMSGILEEWEERSYGYELAIKNHISSIYLWLLRYWHSLQTDSDIFDFQNQDLKKQLSPALTHMLTHYEKPLRATDMAALCHLSYSYFSRSFNRLMQMSFNDYLNMVRIREAEKLLISSTLSITEISAAVGFCTTSYFIKLFKEQMHVSPKQYRKKFLSS